MKIKIHELGAIKDGSIDLTKKLNVFCGPNGTGKTYVAYAIYGLLKSKIHVGFDRELVANLIEKKNIQFEIDFQALLNYRSELIKNFKDNYDGLFGIGADLAKQYFTKTTIGFNESDDEFQKQLLTAKFENKLTIGKLNIFIKKKPNEDILYIELLDSTFVSNDIENLNIYLYSTIIAFLSTYPVTSTYFLPVERNSIYTFSKELSIRKQEAVDHFHAMTGKGKVDKFELLFNKTTRYPLPIKDGLLVADDLAEIRKNKSEYFEFATKIENELLNGLVDISNEGEIQFRPRQFPKKILPIHMTASIIKSLSSLVVYLKHLAQKNDLIIIDEPEINLHPDNQIILTRLFAKLINNDFRLLISTHSDYVVREINNLLMLSKKSSAIDQLKEKYKYSKDEVININDIDVYYFNYPLKLRGNKQVTIRKLKLDESGFEIPSVDAAINSQNEIAEDLFYALKYMDDNE
ncbi:AAA family ATPase [Chryseobacterium taihuense]|uniref:Predicted ATPase n=1 Tax=Chryseobacterium taihuense TaxID=1141221 RepID=A0ABY0QVB9_9FLAO|nr:AAA family ATPase [Chryseobacterium taihuense]SDL96475.1 Predicted ATPase [Chryseobacterium taihuense]